MNSFPVVEALLKLTLAIIVFCRLPSHGYPTGAPIETCATMLPLHDNNSPQSSPSPYSVLLNRNGDEFIVTLSDNSGTSPFEGFLMQARRVESSTVIGQFTALPDSSAQLRTCLVANNSVTHTDNKPKNSVQFTWNSRGADLSNVYIIATVVQKYDTFWSDVRSEELASVANDPCLAVELVTREEWNARPPTSVVYIQPPVNMTFVHHTAGTPCYQKDTCISIMQGIQDYHMDSQGWSDIGYSFLIGEDGRVYEGRGWDVVGAHTPTYNSVSLGFSVMGNFMTRLPDELALTAVKNIIACGVQQGHITEDYELFGHRDGRCTLCPGDQLYAEIRTWPHYSFREIPIWCPDKTVPTL